MRWVAAIVLILLASGVAAAADGIDRASLMAEGQKAELAGKWLDAALAYSGILVESPDDPEINLKVAEMLIGLNWPEDAASFLVKALDSLNSDPGASNELKMQVCDALMNRLPAALTSRKDYKWNSYNAPFDTLPQAEKIRIYRSVPHDWLIKSKLQEAYLLRSVSEYERADSLAHAAIIEGDWQWGAAYLSSSGLDNFNREYLLNKWRKEAERTDNPMLWIVLSAAYARTARTAAFFDTFPRVIKAVKKFDEMLVELQGICEELKWDDGVSRVKKLLPPPISKEEPISQKEPISQIEPKVDPCPKLSKAVAEKNLKQAELIVSKLQEDSPRLLKEAGTPELLEAMLVNGWDDLALKIAPHSNDPYEFSPVVIPMIKTSLYNRPQLENRIKNILNYHLPEQVAEKVEEVIHARSSHYDEEPQDERVWYLENTVNLLPEHTVLTELLIDEYENEGYSPKAFDVAIRAAKLPGKIESQESPLITYARNYNQSKESNDKLFETRKQLSVDELLGIAAECNENQNPAEAIRWIDEAISVSISRYYTKKAASVVPVYPNIPQNELKEIASSTENGNNPFSGGIYRLRLDCLGKLGRKNEARLVLSEAKKLYPNEDFENSPKEQKVSEKPESVISIPSLSGSAFPGILPICAVPVPADPADNLLYLKEQVRAAGLPNSNVSIHYAVTDLANALAKSSANENIDVLARQLLPLMPRYQKLLVLSVDLFRNRMSAVIPLARCTLYIDKSSKDGQFTATCYCASAIARTGDNGLACAYALAATLIEPNLSPLDKFWNKAPAGGWYNSLPKADYDELMVLLAEDLPHGYPYDYVKGIPIIKLGDLYRQYLDRVYRLTGTLRSELNQNSLNRSSLRIDRGLDELSKGNRDWKPFTAADARELAVCMFQEGMKAQAIRFLDIVIANIDENEKPKVIELSQRIRELDELAVIVTPYTLSPAVTELLDSGKRNDAWNLCCKFFEENEIVEYRAKALSEMVRIDPHKAFRLINTYIPNMRIGNNGLYYINAAVYQLLRSDPKSAVKALPVLKRLVEISKYGTENCARKYGAENCARRNYALALILAGQNDKGIDILFHLDDPLYHAFRIIDDACIPKKIRLVVSNGLKEYLRTEKPSIAGLSEVLGGYGGATSQDGVVLIMDYLSEYIRDRDCFITEEFIQKVYNVQFSFISDKIEPEVKDTVYTFFKTVILKAAATPGDKRELGAWLLNRSEGPICMGYGTTKQFKQLYNFAINLYNGG
ncbi:MAG: hypothetical protein ABFD64_06860 [Armatimonadota bacterium]